MKTTMTVKETVAFIPGKNKYYISYDGSNYPYNPECNLHVIAFGDFEVDHVSNYVNEEEIEIILKTCLIKNGSPV